MRIEPTLDREPRVAAGSKLLNDFKAGRERERREKAARAEAARNQADFRRHGHRMLRSPQPALAASMPQPAFGRVAGERAFAAAGTDRLNSSWTAFSTGINADLEMALTPMRARSRDWTVNTAGGARFMDLVADNIVSSDAPRLQVRAKLRDGSDALDEVANTAVETAWAIWCERGRCEVTGELSFAEICRTVVQTTARDGEYLTRRVRDKRLDFGFALQLLDVDRIDTTMNRAPAVRGGNAVRLGVEIDSLGRKVAVHLYNRHPGDAGAGLAPTAMSERVLMDQLLHGFVLKREEQVRGFPWAAPVLKRANSLDKYEEFAMVAAKYGAAKMGFYTIDHEAVNTTEQTWETMRDATGELAQEVDAGLLEALPPGVDFKSWDPKYPHENYAPFTNESKRDIAAGLGVAHHNFTGNMTGVNYSSARIAELAERRHWRALQKWFINSFVMPVFQDWLRMALLTGQIRLPSGAALPAERFDKFAAAASFQPPGWNWVDPEADVKTAAIAMTYDMRSLRQISDENGVDQEDVLLDKQRLMARYTALGLPIPSWMLGGAAAMASGAPQPSPAPAPAKPEEATA